MKELVKVSSSGDTVARSEQLRAAAVHIVTALCSFLASRAAITGGLIPFGLSVVAGVPVMLTPAAAVGAFAGYIIPAVGSGAFRYLAAMFAILSVKLLLGNDRKLAEHPLFLCILSVTCCLFTSAVTFNGLEFYTVGIFAEALLAAGGTFFVCRSVKALLRETAGFSGDELAAWLICISFLFIGADRISVYGVTLGRVLSIVLILICGKYGGILSGAISGAAMSFASLLSGTAVSISAVYAISGVVSGIFCLYGKYAQLGAVFATTLVGVLVSLSGADGALRMVELIAGCVIFLVLPRGLGVPLGKIFSAYPQIITPAGVKKSVTMRLQLASNALSDVSETVEQVSSELAKINSPDYNQVISHVERDACTGCNFRIHCWETKRAETLEALLCMTKAVKSGNNLPQSEAPPEFKGHCLRTDRVGAAVYKNYTEYALKTAAQNRLEEVRSVVSDQFSGISCMLLDLADELTDEEKFDSSSAVAAVEGLKSLGIGVDECSCCIDRFGRMTVKAKLKKHRDLVLNKRQIMKMLSVVCERDFGIPSISEVGNDVYITLGEHAYYSVQFGVHQISAGGAKMCGDAYRHFNDGRGRFTMILSDGMGTGGRAAVDGAMASGLMARLLRAGFGYDCSLKILNSAMLFKSTDESLATVDIASIDLHSGKVDLYKAGAAPTVIRRSGRTGKAQSSSLPAGILRDIGFDRANIKLKVGDIILLMSDGAVSEGTDWIRDELLSWQDGTADDLAQHICECARRRRSDDHEDDITVMAAILTKAV